MRKAGRRKLTLIGPNKARHKRRGAPLTRRLSAKQQLPLYQCLDQSSVDAFGEEYSAVHPPLKRRKNGITFTPIPIVEWMVRRAQGLCSSVVRVVDPGAGTGRFTVSAALAFPNASIIAVEKDPELAKLLAANVARAGVSHRVKIVVADFREVTFPQVDGVTLFIGNPPYVRHHDLDLTWKLWYAQLMASWGIKASQLAGLHLHFIAKALSLARNNDVLCFITAAEWLDVGYGSALRAALIRSARNVEVSILRKEVSVFPDAMTSAVICLFRVGRGSASLSVREIASVGDLDEPVMFETLSLSSLTPVEGWSRISLGRVTSGHGGSVELGELFDVHRGQVTGNNRVWIQGAYGDPIPESVLFPAITRARELLCLREHRLLSDQELRRVIDIPEDWVSLDGRDRERISRFLRWAKAQGAGDSYIARHRNPWYRVGLRPPAPIVVTYMARRSPRFVRNLCGARLVNIAHGLYPTTPLSEADLDLLTIWLNGNVSRSSGRTYAGGLTKFEPGEIRRLRIPKFDELLERLGAQ